MQSSLGTSFMCEVAKLNGGSEKNFEPAFAKIKELLPNVAAVAPSPGALATLFQQGEVWIAPNYYNSIMLLKERGVDVEFAIPETGAVAIRTTIHIVKNSKVPDLALKYIDVLLSPKVQAALMEAPYFFVSSSKAVNFPEKTRALLGANVDELMKKVVLLDWAEINKTRPQLIDRYNREVKL
jgi:putative spermidine/putrescine transport system substrate-binding protein